MSEKDVIVVTTPNLPEYEMVNVLGADFETADVLNGTPVFSVYRTAVIAKPIEKKE